MEKETRQQEEYDLVKGLLEAADYRTSSIAVSEEEIRRNGKLLFRVRIHPLGNDDFQTARKKATTISTAKAFADVYNFKTVGISSLEGLAYNIKNDISLLNINVICSLIDAKNENVYYGLFDKNYNMLEELSTCSINELIDKLKKFNTSIALVGDGAIAYRNKLEQSLGQDLSNSTEIDLNNSLEVSSTLSTYFFEEEKNLASSISIARFAYNKYVNSNGATKDYNSSLFPMYLRKSQAERSLEEKQERQGE